MGSRCHLASHISPFYEPAPPSVQAGMRFFSASIHPSAQVRPFSLLLGAQKSELLEGALQAPRHVGYKHLAGLGSYTLGGVDRPPRDEDERPGRRADLALADQEERLSL